MSFGDFLNKVIKAHPNLTLLEVYDLANLEVERYNKEEDIQVAMFFERYKHVEIDLNNEDLPNIFKRWRLRHPNSTADDVTVTEDFEMADQKNPAADSSKATLERLRRTTLENMMAIMQDLLKITAPTEPASRRVVPKINDNMDALTVQLAAAAQLVIDPSQFDQIQKTMREVQVKAHEFAERVDQVPVHDRDGTYYEDFDFRAKWSVFKRRTYDEGYCTVPQVWETWTRGFKPEEDSIYKVNRHEVFSEKGSPKERRLYWKRHLIAKRIKKIAEERKISLKEAALVVEHSRLYPKRISLNTLSKKILYEDKPIYQ